jgi:hypothetical protein
MFLAVTSTPGIKAPLASETVPLNAALTWAKAGEDARSSNIETATIFFFIMFSHPPSGGWKLSFARRVVRKERGNISEKTTRETPHCEEVVTPPA